MANISVRKWKLHITNLALLCLSSQYLLEYLMTSQIKYATLVLINSIQPHSAELDTLLYKGTRYHKQNLDFKQWISYLIYRKSLRITDNLRIVTISEI